MESPVLGLLITLLLVLVNAFFVAAEFAIVKVRASQIELLVQAGSRTAKMGQYLILPPLMPPCRRSNLALPWLLWGLGWIGEPIVAKLILEVMHLVGLESRPGFGAQYRPADCLYPAHISSYCLW